MKKLVFVALVALVGGVLTRRRLAGRDAEGLWTQATRAADLR